MFWNAWGKPSECELPGAPNGLVEGRYGFLFCRVPVDCAVCGWGVSMSKGLVEEVEGVKGASLPLVGDLVERGVERGVRDRVARRELSRGAINDVDLESLPPSRTNVSMACSTLPFTPFRIAIFRE